MPRFDRADRSAAIGARLCVARITAGMSLPTLAAALGLSGQQLYKYERGISRLPAVMIEDLGRLLGRPVVYFLTTDDDALAKARLLQLPDHPALCRQFLRAVDVLTEPGDPASARALPAPDHQVPA